MNGTELLDFGWSLLVDGFPGTSRETVMDKLAEMMDEHPCPKFEDIGMSEVEQRRSAAMVGVVGGPAPLRDPDAPVPDVVRRIREQADADK